MLDCIELKRAETNEQTIPDLYFKINHRSRSYLHRLLNLLQFSFFKDRTFFYRFILRKRGFKKQKKKKQRALFLGSFFFFVVPHSFDFDSNFSSERSDSKREHFRIENSNIFSTIDAPKCTRLPSRPIRFRLRLVISLFFFFLFFHYSLSIRTRHLTWTRKIIIASYHTCSLGQIARDRWRT